MAIETGWRAARVVRAYVPLLFAIGTVSVPVVASAIDVSGTVVYSGTQGPVSAARPIQVVLGTNLQPVDQVQVETSPGDFTLHVPAPGGYFLATLLDVTADAAPNVGEPFQFYNHRVDPASADVLSVPAEGVTGLHFDLDDTSLLSGVGGTVSYTGSGGPVGSDHPLVVELYTDAALTMMGVDAQRIERNPGRFDLLTFNTSVYYLRTFLDMNRNGVADAAEPFTVYSNRGSAPGDPIVAGPGQNALTLSFGDEFVVQNTPTETPPATSTPVATETPTTTTSACPGDCDGNGAVAVNELIRGVNIALGTAAVSICPSVDVDRSGTVTINELIQAVNRALVGC